MELGILIASLLLRFGPVITEEIVVLIHKEETTLEDWLAIFKKVKSLDTYVAEAKAEAVKAEDFKVGPETEFKST